MADINDLMNALRKADSAGNEADAKALAAMIRRETSNQSVIEEEEEEVVPVVQDRGLTNTNEDEGVFQETLEGIGSGATKIIQGIGELVVTPVDLAFDTNLSSKVTEAGEAVRDYAGLDPVGFLPAVAEVITQFVLPAGKAANVTNKVFKAKRAAKGITTPLTKAERFSLSAKQIAAAGLADLVVSTDGTTTIGDFFEGGPTQTDQTVGLEGRSEALRRLSNRVKLGVEATGAGVIAETALRGLGAIGSAGAQTQAGQGIIKSTLKYPKQLVDNVRSLEERRLFATPGSAEELSKGQKLFTDILATTRYRSFLPDRIATERLLSSSRIQPDVKKAEVLLNRVEKGIDSSLKKLPKGESKLRRSEILNKMDDYLTAEKSLKPRILNDIPKLIRDDLKAMRFHIDDLSAKIKNSNFLKDNDFINKNTNKSIKDTIQDNVSTYLKRRYRIFEDAKYVPDAQTLKIADDFFKTNKSAVESELTKAVRTQNITDIPQYLADIGGTVRFDKIRITGEVSDTAARLARENYLQRFKIKNRRSPLSGGRVATEKLNTKMFIERENVPKELRKLLGEIDDPREAYLGTVSDLAQFTAVDDFFGKVKNLADNDEGFGKFFINPNKLQEAQLKQMVDSGQYVQLGSGNGRSTLLGEGAKEGVEETLNTSGWGSLYGYVVPERVYKDLTNQIIGEDNVLGQLGLGAMGGLLRLKGVSQYGKTILSPITQIRNFTTASLFALSQGNIGKGAHLRDSLRLVMGDLRSKPTDQLLKELEDMQIRGVLGTQTEVREIQDMLSQGAGYRQEAPNSAIEGLLGKKISELKGVKATSKVIKKAEQLYTGSDDFWKIYNYTFEQNKIRNAIESLTSDQKFKYLTDNLADFEKKNLKETIDQENLSSMLSSYVRKDGVDSTLNKLVKDKAASIVRETVPNYNKAPDIIKFARKLPVGNFITFPYEIYRTGFNTIKQGLDELSSEVPGIRKIGMRRLTGFVSTVGVLTPAVAATAYQLSGVSREEMKAYQRSFGQDWEKNAVLIPNPLKPRSEDGSLEYINWSTTNPYDTLIRAANAAMNAIGTGGKLNKSVPQIMGDVTTQALKETAEPFLSQSMVFEALIDTTIRKGRTTSGAEVYNPEDTDGTKFSKSFVHLLGSVLPSVVPVNVSAGKMEPSRFARGVIGKIAPDLISSKTRTGLERDLTEELFRSFSGVTPLKFDPEKGLKYKAFELSRAQVNSKKIFNKVTKNANATPASFLKAYTKANEAKFRVDQEYYQVIQDLKTLGYKDTDIRKVFKRNSIGGINGIMRGRFEPFVINKNHYRNMQDVGTRNIFPRTEINNTYQQLRQLRFEEPQEEPQEEYSLSTPKEQVVEAPQVQVAETPVVESNIQPSAIQNIDTSGAVNTANVSPELLGDDPFSQAANAQIARRLNA